MSENTFYHNFGCIDMYGTAIIACIPEKHAFLPYFIQTTLGGRDQRLEPSLGETWRWLSYYPSVNQKDDGITGLRETYSQDYDKFTQDVFTQFVKTISLNAGTQFYFV